MAEATKKCGDCAHFQTDGCHRYPPVVVWIGHEPKTVYPQVTQQQIACGEFQKKTGGG